MARRGNQSFLRSGGDKVQGPNQDFPLCTIASIIIPCIVSNMPEGSVQRPGMNTVAIEIVIRQGTGG